MLEIIIENGKVSAQCEKQKREIGQFYKDENNNVFILAQTRSGVGLISLKTGNRYKDEVHVHSCNDISDEEWQEITGDLRKFELIK